MVRTTQALRSEDELLRLDPATGSLRVRHYELRVVAGPDAGKSAPLTGVLLVGTQDAAGLCLSDPTVSRHHVELEARADGVRVRDLDSRNGTYLAGARVQEVVLEHEAVLQVGNSKLMVAFSEGTLESPPEETSLGGVVGESPPMRALLGLLKRVAASDSTVVLLGETGTGKEVLAQAIHGASRRADRPFQVLDCAAISRPLIESELFGHAKGAFTGAVAERRGAFLAADGGTLFLDELGELPLELQPKLLRVLESGMVKRIGEDKPRRVDVRVVAATHRDLEAEVKAGRFRQDLYFRLAVVLVRIPPLRDRAEDIQLLVRHFLDQMGRADFAILPKQLEAWRARPWPGNVRELRNAVERLLVLPPGAQPATSHPKAEGYPPPDEAALTDAQKTEERGRIAAALERCGGNQTLAAKQLGISRRTLLNRLDQHGLPRPRKGSAR